MLSFIFGVSMQPLFEMINSLQITALIPLTNLYLPANAMLLFEVLMHIVAFEYFPMYNPGFTETEPYTYKFAWFGFETINFVQLLGTFLTILIAILLIQTVFGLGILFVTHNVETFFRHQNLIRNIRYSMRKKSWIRSKVYPVAVMQSWI